MTLFDSLVVYVYLFSYYCVFAHGVLAMFSISFTHTFIHSTSLLRYFAP